MLGRGMVLFAVQPRTPPSGSVQQGRMRVAAVGAVDSKKAGGDPACMQSLW